MTHLMRFSWQKSHADRSSWPLAADCNGACYFEGMVEIAPLEPTVDAKTLAKVCLHVWSSHVEEYKSTG